MKNRETVLMMHEVAVSCVNASKPVRFGMPEFDHRKNQGPRFRKRTTSRTRVKDKDEDKDKDKDKDLMQRSERQVGVKQLAPW